MTEVGHQPLWKGPDKAEATATYRQCREAGMSPMRALAVAQMASFRDCYAFAKSIAEWVGCSRRTVQRGAADAKRLGFVASHRAKKNERTPGDPEFGGGKLIPCGWSHRFVIGRGKAGAARNQAVAEARARWNIRQALRQAEEAAKRAEPKPKFEQTTPQSPRRGRARPRTAAEIDAELARIPPGTFAGPDPPD